MAAPLEFDSTWRKGRVRLITRDSPMIDGLRPAVTEATERGLLRPDVTAERFAMAAIGPLFYQRFLVGPFDDRTVDAVVDIAWRAYSPTPRAVSRPGVSVFRGTAGSHRAADRS